MLPSLNGVLELNGKSVVEIMTPIDDVVTVSADAIVDHALIDKLCVVSLKAYG